MHTSFDLTNRHGERRRGTANRAAWIALACTGAALALLGVDPDRAGAADLRAPSGILYDRVAPGSEIERHDGSPTAVPASRSSWNQTLFELTRAAVAPPEWPDVDAVRQSARQLDRQGLVPIALLDFDYEMRQPATGTQPSPEITAHRAFAATTFRAATHRGGDVVFVLDRSLLATNRAGAPPTLAVDFADGSGWRPLAWGERRRVHYPQTGRYTVRVRAVDASGRTLYAAFPFDVLHLGTPAPDDTLHVVASTPYLGTAGQGDAYVDLAPGHASLVNPILVIEGFDLDNSMSWDELYQMLNEHGLLDSLQEAGFDAVILDFADATDYIQRNAFVFTELLQQVQAAIPVASEVVVVGASMGGLVGRYGLAYLESQAQTPRVRTFISFDSPQRGANIPLGVQYWVQFFASQSAEAALLRDLLNTPAARQMLVYHFTDPPTSTPASDPLRSQLLADLVSVGGYPTQPRRVAIANGSGTGVGQGFAPGEQIVRYEYSSILARLTGNVWAVPNGPSTTIFRGVIDYFFPPPEQQQTVAVSGTAPYDNAPGGWRSSMADMDAVAAPVGDIVALHPNHCFIPTTSALDLDTANLFYDIAGDPNLLTHTPFDAVYFPAENQQHVLLTAENAAWLLGEIIPVPSGSGDPVVSSPAALRLFPNVPNPFNPATQLEFDLPRAGDTEVSIHDVRGRLVATVWNGRLEAGRHRLSWDGTSSRGVRMHSGVYLWTVRGPEARASRRIVLAK